MEMNHDESNAAILDEMLQSDIYFEKIFSNSLQECSDVKNFQGFIKYINDMFPSQYNICHFPNLSENLEYFSPNSNNSVEILDKMSFPTYLLSFFPEQSIIEISQLLSSFFSVHCFNYEIVSITNNSKFTYIKVKSDIPHDLFSQELPSFLRECLKAEIYKLEIKIINK